MTHLTLNPEILHAAYSQGYFPMPDADSGEILWFRPDPRAIIPLDGFHISRTLRRRLRRQEFKVTINEVFYDVMRGCANRNETWITDEFIIAYGQLHALGEAHSVEVWQDDKLVGGTYGVSMGGAFFAESMFSRVTDASKVALYYLVAHLRQRGFLLLECQFLTEHLRSLGAIEIPDSTYIEMLEEAIQAKVEF